MTIVADASTVVAAVIDSGPTGSWALDWLTTRHPAAPHLLPVECASVLRRAALAGDIEADSASLAHADLLDLTIAYFPYEPFAHRIWELRANLTPYDAWYVALAEHLGCALVTLDKRIRRAPGVGCEVLTP